MEYAYLAFGLVMVQWQHGDGEGLREFGGKGKPSSWDAGVREVLVSLFLDPKRDWGIRIVGKGASCAAPS